MSSDTREFLILAGLAAAGSVALAFAGQTNLAGAVALMGVVFLTFAYVLRKKKD